MTQAARRAKPLGPAYSAHTIPVQRPRPQRNRNTNHSPALRPHTRARPAPHAPRSYSMLAVQIESDPHAGMLYVGRIHSGVLRVGERLWALDAEGQKVGEGKVKKILVWKGLERVEMQRGRGRLLVQSTPIDPPTISIHVQANDSPLAGTSGTKLNDSTFMKRTVPSICLKAASLPSFIERIDLSSIASPATAIRKRTALINMVCTVNPLPKASAFNVVWFINFEDYVIEYLSRTSIPIPLIHDFSVDTNNVIGRPYTFFDHVEGTQLGKLWFDPKWFTEKHRKNVFRSLVSCMVQLRNLEFDYDAKTDSH
ncbi:hypothetical protein C0989_007098, partial [Termitomyces sp. Mn162]